MFQHILSRYVREIIAFLLGFIVGLTYMTALLLMRYGVISGIFPPKSYINVRNEYNITCKFSYYYKLLKELKRDRYRVLRVIDFIRLARNGSLPRDKVIVILRHDVDVSPQKAFLMSRLEYNASIYSTYYIRIRGPYNIFEENFYEWLIWLHNNGFEIGLHYETLYLTNYNFSLAEKMFLSDLNVLRSVVPVYTVCSHGNSPRQKYPNYEIFKRNDTLLKIAELEGEAYITIYELIAILRRNGSIAGYIYLSDTYKRDIDWIGKLREVNTGTIVYILIHPDNWYLDKKLIPLIKPNLTKRWWFWNSRLSGLGSSTVRGSHP